MKDGHLQSLLANVIIQWCAGAAQEKGKRFPVFDHVMDGLTQAGVGFDFLLIELIDQPGFEIGHNRSAMFLVVEEALFRGKALFLALSIVAVNITEF